MALEVRNAIMKISFQKEYTEGKTEQESKIQMGSMAAIPVLTPCSRFLKRCLNYTSYFCGLLYFTFKMTGYTSVTDFTKRKSV